MRRPRKRRRRVTPRRKRLLLWHTTCNVCRKLSLSTRGPWRKARRRLLCHRSVRGCGCLAATRTQDSARLSGHQRHQLWSKTPSATTHTPMPSNAASSQLCCRSALTTASWRSRLPCRPVMNVHRPNGSSTALGRQRMLTFAPWSQRVAQVRVEPSWI